MELGLPRSRRTVHRCVNKFNGGARLRIDPSDVRYLPFCWESVPLLLFDPMRDFVGAATHQPFGDFRLGPGVSVFMITPNLIDDQANGGKQTGNNKCEHKCRVLRE